MFLFVLTASALAAWATYKWLDELSLWLRVLIYVALAGLVLVAGLQSSGLVS